MVILIGILVLEGQVLPSDGHSNGSSLLLGGCKCRHNSVCRCQSLSPALGVCRPVITGLRVYRSLITCNYKVVKTVLWESWSPLLAGAGLLQGEVLRARKNHRLVEEDCGNAPSSLGREGCSQYFKSLDVGGGGKERHGNGFHGALGFV